jgi:dihydrofolate synthase/folylpolyglutamate synthase
VNLPGTFQAANAAVAVEVARQFSGGTLDVDVIQRGLDTARFPGRMEIVQQAPLVLLDGAHNPEKVGSLARNLNLLYRDRRIVLVFGAIESKAHAEMLDLLLPLCETLVATTPKVLAKPSTSADEIGALATGRISVLVEPDPRAAIDVALDVASPEDLVVVAGSLYLVGNVRERWYPSDAILEQGTCWPV